MKTNSVAVVPQSNAATCVTANACTQIDMLVMSQSLFKVVKENDFQMNPVVATHRPHFARFPRNAAEAQELVFYQPEKIPVEVPIGPWPKPCCWVEAELASESS